jgi:hypothetical protein
VTRPSAADVWPHLPLEEWRDTYTTLHLWTQVVGKVRLALAPAQNHWWHVPLEVTARGLSTSLLWQRGRAFQIELDFVSHRLIVQASDGSERSFALSPYSVAEFYRRVMLALAELGFTVHVWPRPVEMEESIPFERDHAHTSYDPDFANRHWRILVQTERVLLELRSRFLGKASPVHFFWGGFDLALSFFSGRPAPPHPGGIPHVADWVMREAYSHECASMGFWPGGGAVQEPAFYAYAYPEPDGYKDHPVEPEQAFYHPEMRELILPYDAVRRSAEPERTLLAFFRSAYEAAAVHGRWDRASLEREPPARGSTEAMLPRHT